MTRLFQRLYQRTGMQRIMHRIKQRVSVPSLGMLCVIPLFMACSLTAVPDPSTIVDPGAVQSQDGAVSAYRGGVGSFGSIFGAAQRSFLTGRGYSFVLADGFASDQFSTENFDGMGEYFMQRSVDPAQGHDLAQPYTDLNTTRLNIDQAIGGLRQYGKTTPKSYIGELFALKGYLYVMTAEMYCSGVPFSRAVYGGDIVLGMPETTAEMLQHAIAQFDTALAVATDSARIRSLAYVGKARAQLDLGLFAEAGATASEVNVPTNFTYNLTYSAQTAPNFFYASTNSSSPIGLNPGNAFMGNRLGGAGLPYAEAGDSTGVSPDPRLAWVAVSGRFGVGSYPIPKKYYDGGAPITLSSGIEARLIQAEAALYAHDVPTWSGILNSLRQNASTQTIPSLSLDSTNAASDTLRTNVMFRERAFWLYGTGHRLGDMRRLVRQYHRTVLQVFPHGNMFPASTQTPMYYTSDTNFVPPTAEAAANQNYHGCLNRDS